MIDGAREINDLLQSGSPAAWSLLSELGRAASYPRDIPFQAAQARKAELNATIGQITDGRGGVLALDAVKEKIGVLAERHLNASILYSPVEGDPELRRLWARHHRPADASADSSLPLVTVGLTQALSLIADLFCEAGRTVLVPAPFWGNYRQIFELRRSARVLPVPMVEKGEFRPEAILAAVAAVAPGDPVVVILNFPSNPMGYSPSAAEREVLVHGLLSAADERPILVVCDDAYAGLIFDDAVPRDSIFWHLAGCHRDLVALKVDGVTKELVLFGARVGFLTFSYGRDSAVTQSLESKAKCLLRASVGSPVALSQQLVLETLLTPGLQDEVAAVHRTLERRYLRLKAAFAAADPDLVRPMPFNSGCFALLELPDGCDAEEVRTKLLAEHATGVIAIGKRHIRLAYCSVEEDSLPALVERIETCLRALAPVPQT